LNVYVETNFVLELALAQEQRSSCEALLRFGEERRVRILLPAYSLAEPYETLKRRRQRRSHVNGMLEQEIGELARSAFYAEQVQSFAGVSSLLLDSTVEEIQRFEAVRAQLLRGTEIIPLDREILESTADLQASYGLDPQDASILASVLVHLGRETSSQSCFLSRDKDFDDPNLVARLRQHGCKLLSRFDDGAGYVQSVLSR